MITKYRNNFIFLLQRVGSDKQGNTFYVHKNKERWVLYKHHIDPTGLEVKWQIYNSNKYR